MPRKPFIATALLIWPALLLSAPLAAMPLSDDECKQLVEKRTALQAQGVVDLVGKDAASGASLADDKLKAVAEYLKLESQLRMRCNLTVSASKDKGDDQAVEGEAAGEASEKPEAAPPANKEQKKSESDGSSAGSGIAKIGDAAKKADFWGSTGNERPQSVARQPEDSVTGHPEWRRQSFGNFGNY